MPKSVMSRRFLATKRWHILQITSLYQQQLGYVFNRPVTKPVWYWQSHEEEASPFGEEEDAMTAFLFYEQLCQQPGIDLLPYSDDQVGIGLTYLFDGTGSNLVHGFKSVLVPIERKIAALRALSVLFKDVLHRAVRRYYALIQRKNLRP
ncbi:MAG: hypothetical protein HC892_21180 [Saprospiraceae bacterium]|nr:hypothetical protein [Saprospiraceae bacterium]